MQQPGRASRMAIKDGRGRIVMKQKYVPPPIRNPDQEVQLGLSPSDLDAFVGALFSFGTGGIEDSIWASDENMKGHKEKMAKKNAQSSSSKSQSSISSAPKSSPSVPFSPKAVPFCSCKTLGVGLSGSSLAPQSTDPITLKSSLHTTAADLQTAASAAPRKVESKSVIENTEDFMQWMARHTSKSSPSRSLSPQAAPFQTSDNARLPTSPKVLSPRASPFETKGALASPSLKSLSPKATPFQPSKAFGGGLSPSRWASQGIVPRFPILKTLSPNAAPFRPSSAAAYSNMQAQAASNETKGTAVGDTNQFLQWMEQDRNHCARPIPEAKVEVNEDISSAHITEVPNAYSPKLHASDRPSTASNSAAGQSAPSKAGTGSNIDNNAGFLRWMEQSSAKPVTQSTETKQPPDLTLTQSKLKQSHLGAMKLVRSEEMNFEGDPFTVRPTPPHNAQTQSHGVLQDLAPDVATGHQTTEAPWQWSLPTNPTDPNDSWSALEKPKVVIMPAGLNLAQKVKWRQDQQIPLGRVDPHAIFGPSHLASLPPPVQKEAIVENEGSEGKWDIGGWNAITNKEHIEDQNGLSNRKLMKQKEVSRASLTQDELSDIDVLEPYDGPFNFDDKVSDDGVEQREVVRANQGKDAAQQLLDWDGKTWLPPPLDWENDRSFDSSFVPAYVREWATTVRGKSPPICERPIHDTEFGEPIVHPHTIPGVTVTDLEEKRKYQTSATDAINLRKKLERRRKITQKTAKANADRVAEILSREPEPNPFAPIIDVYLRPATKKDAFGIAIVYNHWVLHSSVPEDQKAISEDDVISLIRLARDEKTPFIVAVNGNLPETKALAGEEKVIGFAFADSYGYGLNGMRTGRSRYTCNLNLYVDHQHQRKGVGRSLMDRLFQCLSYGYGGRDGYSWANQGNDPAYHQGGAGRWHQLLLTLPIQNKDDPNFPWVKQFLSKFYFVEEARLRCVARSSIDQGPAKWLDLVIFQVEASHGAEFSCWD